MLVGVNRSVEEVTILLKWRAQRDEADIWKDTGDARRVLNASKMVALRRMTRKRDMPLRLPNSVPT